MILLILLLDSGGDIESEEYIYLSNVSIPEFNKHIIEVFGRQKFKEIESSINREIDERVKLKAVDMFLGI